MTTTITQITARKKTPPTEMIWFTGKNALEVAGWLRDRGKSAEVQFHGYGENLRIHGNGKSVPKDHPNGVWLDIDGVMWSKEQVERDFDIIEAR